MGSKGISHSFIMLWSATCPFYFTPRRSIPSIHCIGGWVYCGASLDILEKGKISWPYQELNPVSFSQPCNHYTDCTVPSLVITILTALSHLLLSLLWLHCPISCNHYTDCTVPSLVITILTALSHLLYSLYWLHCTISCKHYTDCTVPSPVITILTALSHLL